MNDDDDDIKDYAMDMSSYVRSLLRVTRAGDERFVVYRQWKRNPCTATREAYLAIVATHRLEGLLSADAARAALEPLDKDMTSFMAFEKVHWGRGQLELPLMKVRK